MGDEPLPLRQHFDDPPSDCLGLHCARSEVPGSRYAGRQVALAAVVAVMAAALVRLPPVAPEATPYAVRKTSTSPSTAAAKFAVAVGAAAAARAGYAKRSTAKAILFSPTMMPAAAVAVIRTALPAAAMPAGLRARPAAAVLAAQVQLLAAADLLAASTDQVAPAAVQRQRAVAVDRRQAVAALVRGHKVRLAQAALRATRFARTARP